MTKTIPASASLEAEGVKIKSADPRSTPGDQSQHLAVGSLELLDSLASWVRPGGFVLLNDPDYRSGRKYENEGLALVAVQPAMETTLVLLRKLTDYVPARISVNVSETGYDWVDELKKALQSGEKFLIVCEGENAGMMGLANCIFREENGTNARYNFFFNVIL